MAVAPVFVGASGPFRGTTPWPSSISITASDLPPGTLPYDVVCMWIVSFHQESKLTSALPFDAAQGPVTEWGGINLSNFTWRQAVHSNAGSTGGSSGGVSWRQSVRVSAYTGIWPWSYVGGVANPPILPVTISPLNSVGNPVVPANGVQPSYAYWQVYLATYRTLRQSTNQSAAGFAATIGGGTGAPSGTNLDVADTNAAFVNATIQIHPYTRDSLRTGTGINRPAPLGGLSAGSSPIWTPRASDSGANGRAGSFKIADRIEALTGFRGPATVGYQANSGAVVGVHASTFTLDDVYVTGDPPTAAGGGIYVDGAVHVA